MKCRFANLTEQYKGVIHIRNTNSLAHTIWECKYQTVFAPKCRRKIIYGKIRADIGQTLSALCKRKGIKIIENEACLDHIHMFVKISQKYSVTEVMWDLNRKNPLMILKGVPT